MKGILGGLGLGACALMGGCIAETTFNPDDCPTPSVSGSATSFDSTGVRVVPLDQFTVSESCLLNPTLVARLGEIDGDGIAGGDWATVRHDPMADSYIVAWSRPAGPLDVFDSEGRYTGSIGGAGEGPGEFRTSPTRFFVRDDAITVLNYPGRGWISFNRDGALLQQRVVEAPPHPRLVEVSGDVIVLFGGATPGSRPAIVDVRTAELMGEFPDSLIGSVRDPARGLMLIARGRGTLTLAGTPRDSLIVREWTLTGELTGVIRGQPSGFPEIGEEPRAGEPPPTTIRDFAFDGAGRLWLVTGVPADTWADYREAMAEYGRSLGPAASGPMEISMDVIYAMPRDTAPRVDVFDLQRGVHLGSWISAERSIGLLERNGEILVQQMEIEETGNPFLAVYRMF